MRLSRLTALIAPCVLFACDGLPRHDQFAAGTSREAILERFGEPPYTREMLKTGDAIWGPIETVWNRVRDGGSVEIWSYRTTHEWIEGSGERQTGTTEVYFIDGSATVSGLGFAPDGVVYEASGSVPSD